MRRFFGGSETVVFLFLKDFYPPFFWGRCLPSARHTVKTASGGRLGSRRSSAHGLLSHKAGFLSSVLYGFFYISWENNRP
jgi:hypothetical protein